MTRLLQILHAVALVLFCAILVPVAYEVWHQRARFESDTRRLSALIGRTEQTMDNFKKASGAWESSSKVQSQQTTAAMQNVTAAAERLSSFISKTDNSLNVDLLPALSQAISQQNAALLATQKDLKSNLSQMQQATIQLQTTLADADKVITDPNIKVSLDNLANASENVATATKEASGTMAKVHEGVDYEVNELMKPVSKIKAITLFAARIVGKLFL